MEFGERQTFFPREEAWAIDLACATAVTSTAKDVLRCEKSQEPCVAHSRCHRLDL